MTDDEDAANNARFQLAAAAARRLVSQSLAHAQRVTTKMSNRVATAVPTSPFGIDQARALSDEHQLAFKQIIEHVEATSNALVSQLAGLKLLLDSDTFHPLPGIVISRSIAEVAASCAWIIGPADSSNDRMARGYAALFSAMQTNILNSRPETARRLAAKQEELIRRLERPVQPAPISARVTLERRVKDGVQLPDEIAQVFVGHGRDRGRAKVAFLYSQRVREEIPRVSAMYSAMSAAAHGEHASIALSWDTPDTYARLIGHVASHSTEAWSRAVHEWVGVKAGPFLNEGDRRNILLSIPGAMLSDLTTGQPPSP